MIYFLNSTLNINISSDKSLGDNYDSGAKKLSERKYELNLLEGFDIPVLVHELWHVYMDSLSTFDFGSVTCSQMVSDIYAYSFENLLRDSLKEIDTIKGNI